MSYADSFKKLSRSKKLGIFLVGTTLAWAVGLPAYLNIVSAAGLTDISDTITSSAPSATTNHSFSWNQTTAVTAGQTIEITLDPGGNAFAITALVAADFTTETGLDVVAGGACSGAASEAELSTTANPDKVILTVCTGDTVSTGAKVLTTANSRFTNPAVVGSYVIRFGGTQADSGDTRVAIISQVTMSAIVPTSLTFTISGVASSTSLAGGLQTSTSTSATAIGFGNLDVGDDEIGAQLLSVATNASNGFQVTVFQNQNLTSSGLDDIDLFKDGAATAVPTAWTSPLNTLGSEATYGHYGITSDDTGLTAGNEFVGGTLYAGNLASARQVMYNTVASNGVGVGLGTTTVAYRIEIASLQEAGTDYNNVLTYVCTPIF